MSFWSNQLNTKTIKTLTIEDIDRIFNSVNIEDDNLEFMSNLIALKEAAGFVAGSPFKGTLSIKRNDMGDSGIANKQTIHRPDEGQVWMMVASSIQIATFADGGHDFFIQTFDTTNSVTHIECGIQVDSIVNEPILNEQTTSGSREGGYNPPIFYDYDNYLVTYYNTTASSQSQDPVICTQVVRVQ